MDEDEVMVDSSEEGSKTPPLECEPPAKQQRVENSYGYSSGSTSGYGYGYRSYADSPTESPKRPLVLFNNAF